MAYIMLEDDTGSMELFVGDYFEKAADEVEKI